MPDEFEFSLSNLESRWLTLARRWELSAEAAIGMSRVRLVRDSQSPSSSREAEPPWLTSLSPKRREEWARIEAPTRRLEWSEARRLELSVRSRLGESALMSVSHTSTEEETTVVVIGLCPSRAFGGVGVDLESRERVIDPRLERRLLTADERAVLVKVQASALEAWVIKEACFKAAPANEGTVLSDYRLVTVERSSDGVLSGEARTPSRTGGLSIGFELLPVEKYLLGWAIARANALIDDGQ